ncbi:unnamed protein product [Rhodiola kirilowii]
MGRPRAEMPRIRSHTLPSSPTHSFSSSSSSDFEFTICSSPPDKSSSAALCPADDLFYKGKLLPLHLSPRLSMVRTMLLASSSASSSSEHCCSNFDFAVAILTVATVMFRLKKTLFRLKPVMIILEKTMFVQT